MASLFIHLIPLMIFLGLGNTTYNVNLSPLVTTTTGTVQGVCFNENGNHVTAFLGIPFAEPPTGDLRFKKPVPVEHWQGILEATKKSPQCMQPSPMGFPWQSTVSHSSEDCLFLNIWVPTKQSVYHAHQTAKPVMVWIHGGGFFSGSSNLELYDGATLSDQGDVIVISFNYRLGNFGFFVSGTDDALGNMGLFDQKLALTWIKNNVVFFGGDPNKITLFGESAGSISALLQAISPLTTDLFSRVIAESGSPFHPVFPFSQELGKVASNVFAVRAGCADDEDNLFTNPKKVTSCLQEKDASELAKVEGTFLVQALYYFLPTYGDEYLPENPTRVLMSGDFKKSEILIGINRDEGSVFLNYVMPQVFPAKTTPVLSLSQARDIIQLLYQNSSQPSPKEVADFYLKNVDENDAAAIVKAVYDSYGEFIISCSAVFAAERYDESAAYFYYFTQRSSNSLWGEWMGETHFDEVAFVFGDPIRHPGNYTVEEREFSRKIMKMWTNFARHGTPIPFKGNQVWPKFTAASPNYLELNAKGNKVGYGPLTESCNFWRPYFIAASQAQQ